MMEARPIEIPSSRIDRWKLENGQWKWYHDASKDTVPTLLGAMPAAAPGGVATQAPKLPKDITPEEAEKAIKKVPAPKSSIPTLSRESMPFTVGQESTEEIVFHNNTPGEIRVDADLIADFPGFAVQPRRNSSSKRRKRLLSKLPIILPTRGSLTLPCA